MRDGPRKGSNPFLRAASLCGAAKCSEAVEPASRNAVKPHPLGWGCSHDGWRVIEEREWDTNPDQWEARRQYIYGGRYIDEVLLFDKDTDDDGDCNDAGGSARYLYCQNNNYNVVALTDADGVVVEKVKYDPYGTPTCIRTSDSHEQTASHYGNPYLFQGRRYDSESGLYYFRNRDMSPTLGRFMQRDPVGYVDGMSLYEFISCLPVTLVDPMGYEADFAGGIYLKANLTNIRGWQRTFVLVFGEEWKPMTIAPQTGGCYKIWNKNKAKGNFVETVYAIPDKSFAKANMSTTITVPLIVVNWQWHFVYDANVSTYGVLRVHTDKALKEGEQYCSKGKISVKGKFTAAGVLNIDFGEVTAKWDSCPKGAKLLEEDAGIVNVKKKTVKMSFKDIRIVIPGVGVVDASDLIPAEEQAKYKLTLEREIKIEGKIYCVEKAEANR